MTTFMWASTSPVALRLAGRAKTILIRRIVAQWLLAAFLLCATVLSSAADLPSGHGLGPGQGIYSDNGQYLLLMQSDGNLVYYRVSDGAVRWHTNTWGTPGAVLAMQGDGNAVTYYTPPIIPAGKDGGYAKPQPQQTYATWYSATSGNPGAYMRAQNDGNLVVLAANGQTLWGTGADPDLNKEDPRKKGDVVGRDMEHDRPYSYLGHIGFFDGTGVFEVLNDGAINAVAYNSLGAFKARVSPVKYWGGGSPNIPDYLVWGCYATECVSKSSFKIVQARQGMAERAFQILVLGASYTYFSTYTPAGPKYTSAGAREGIYRCDTFVLDVYHDYGNRVDAQGLIDTKNWPVGTPMGNWLKFRADLRDGVITPLTLFNKLKNFSG